MQSNTKTSPGLKETITLEERLGPNVPEASVSHVVTRKNNGLSYRHSSLSIYVCMYVYELYVYNWVQLDIYESVNLCMYSVDEFVFTYVGGKGLFVLSDIRFFCSLLTQFYRS